MGCKKSQKPLVEQLWLPYKTATILSHLQVDPACHPHSLFFFLSNRTSPCSHGCRDRHWGYAEPASSRTEDRSIGPPRMCGASEQSCGGEGGFTRAGGAHWQGLPRQRTWGRRRRGQGQGRRLDLSCSLTLAHRSSDLTRWSPCAVATSCFFISMGWGRCALLPSPLGRAHTTTMQVPAPPPAMEGPNSQGRKRDRPESLTPVCARSREKVSLGTNKTTKRYALRMAGE